MLTGLVNTFSSDFVFRFSAQNFHLQEIKCI